MNALTQILTRAPESGAPIQSAGRSRSNATPEFVQPPVIRTDRHTKLGTGQRVLKTDACEDWLRGMEAERTAFASNHTFGMHAWERVRTLSADLGVPNAFDTAAACALLATELRDARMSFAQGLLSHLMLCVYSDLDSWPHETPSAAAVGAPPPSPTRSLRPGAPDDRAYTLADASPPIPSPASRSAGFVVAKDPRLGAAGPPPHAQWDEDGRTRKARPSTESDSHSVTSQERSFMRRYTQGEYELQGDSFSHRRRMYREAQPQAELAALLRRRLPYFELMPRLVRMMEEHRKRHEEATQEERDKCERLRKRVTTLETERARMQDEIRRAGAESRALLTRMGVMSTTIKVAGKWRKRVTDKKQQENPSANSAIEALVCLGQAERFQAVQSLCEALDDDEVELMLPQLFRTITKPSALLITQLLNTVEGHHLADVLGKFADALPLSARCNLFAQLPTGPGLDEEERGSIFASLSESWGDKDWLRAAQLLMTMGAAARIACISEVLAPHHLPTPSAHIDAAQRLALLELLKPETAEAVTQLPVEHGEGGGDGGELLPLEEELLMERLQMATFQERSAATPRRASGNVLLTAMSSGRGTPTKPRRGSAVVGGGASRKSDDASSDTSTGPTPKGIRRQKMVSSSQDLAHPPLPMRTLPVVWASLLARSKKLVPDVWPLPRLLSTIAQIYFDKIEAEEAEEKEGIETTPWPDFVLSWLVRSAGLRSKAVIKLNGLLHTARFYARKSARACAFAELCGLEAAYDEQRVARLLRVLQACVPRAQLLTALSRTDEQWVPLRAADAHGDELRFEAMVASLFADEALARERDALLAQAERAMAGEEQLAEGDEENEGSEGGVGGAAAQPAAAGGGQRRLPLDEAVALLVSGVAAAEKSEDDALRAAFAQALLDQEQSKGGGERAAAPVGGEQGVLTHESFTNMVLQLDARRTTREIDTYFLEALELSDAHDQEEGANFSMTMTDVIQQSAWLQIANLHGLRPNVSRRRSSLKARRRTP